MVAASSINHLTVWLFDLDNTLYPSASPLMHQVDARIEQFMISALDVSQAHVRALRRTYKHKYGTTLRGLMTCHGIAPGYFLDYVHNIDYSGLGPDHDLRKQLTRSSLRKIVFTNSPGSHARKVLECLGLLEVFEGLFAIEHCKFIPKPNIKAYNGIVDHFGFDPSTTAFFEDTPANLLMAKKMGMATVLVRSDDEPPLPDEETAYCDFVTNDLVAWLEAANTAHERLPHRTVTV